MAVTTISPHALAERLEQGHIDLIDVRTPAEFREVHAVPARNLPLDQLNPASFRHDRLASTGPVYVICKSGSRSARACERLATAGVDVVSVDGGTEAWEAAQLPVRRGRKSVSLERQVRITAGSLALLGAVLGFFVHPYLIGISAFIGAGLMFSGITDTCGMGTLLSRMPWNQVNECDATIVTCAKT